MIATRRVAAIMVVDVSLLIDDYEASTAPADGRKSSSTSCLLSIASYRPIVLKNSA
jgi:hypothetical protein